jgi:hypothetical protein
MQARAEDTEVQTLVSRVNRIATPNNPMPLMAAVSEILATARLLDLCAHVSARG